MTRFVALALSIVLVAAACTTSQTSPGAITGTSPATATAVVSSAPSTTAPAAPATPTPTTATPGASTAPSTASACPPDQAAYVALIKALNMRLHFGQATLPFNVQTFQARFAPVAVADQVPPFAGFDPAAPAIAETTGARVQLDSAASGVTLTGADVQAWRRSDVVAADGTIKHVLGDRIDLQALAATGGTATWAAPATAGDYVVGIAPVWGHACMTGTGYTYVSLRLT